MRGDASSRVGTPEVVRVPDAQAASGSPADWVLTSPDGDQTIRWREGERLEDLFEDRCDRLREEGRADQFAVDTEDLSLTYDQLDARANQLARHLLRLGVRPGDRVGLLLDQALHAYVGMLAVLKCHGAYVPLDVGFPPDRLAYIVQDAGVRLVLSQSHLRDRLDDVGARVVCLDEVDALVGAEDDDRLSEADLGNPVDDLCYIIYTSGTTGTPKGVAVEHASICNFVRVAAGTYGIELRDRVYQGMTIAFDFSVEEIWVPWMSGATLVPKPGGSSLVGPELGEFIRANSISALCCVPTLLATLEDDLPGLRFLLVSGEACPRDLVGRWHRPGRRFLNVYGPTEATVTATWTALDPGRAVTLGVPLPTYSAVILDPDDGRALPPGEIGEIGIAGIGLAKGYVNRDDLTDLAFIPDFIGIEANPSGRIYRTGDLGRVNGDGEIEYLGRIDTQVKIRGYRIELTEIESVLLQIPGIAQAVVEPHEPEPGVKELVAYYTVHAKGDGGPGAERIYDHLRERLPPYMVPAYLEEIDTVPLLPSDKVDRKRLPPPSNRRTLASQRAYVPPATQTEQALAGALAGVMRLDHVSVDGHFFDELGADSLLMARFCARTREIADLPPVSMRDVYLQPTIRDLAAALSERVVPADSEPIPAMSETRAPAGTPWYLFCGFLQLLLFFGTILLDATVLAIGLNWLTNASGMPDLYVRSLVFGAGTFLFLSALPIVAKWVLVGRWRPQEIRVWTPSYVRFWIVKTLIRSSPLVLFVGSPLYVLYLRALGAKIGRNVVILSRSVPVCTDLLSIGDGTVIRKDSFFYGYRVDAGVLRTGPVTLGKDVFVGEKTVLDINTWMGDGSQLGHASSLHAPQAVPDGERWHGCPAERADVNFMTVAPAACSRLRRFGYSAMQILTLLAVTVPLSIGVVVALIDRVPFLADLIQTGYGSLGDPSFYVEALVMSLVVFFGGALAGFVFILTVPRLLHRTVDPGVVRPLYGFHYWIQRTIARTTNVAFYTDLFGDSSYIVNFLQALGYDLRPVEQTGSNFGTELKHETPYLTRVGGGTMVSDALSIMNAEYSSTSFRVSRVEIGKRNFLGNNIAYPAGGRTGDNCLLGTKVMVPIDGEVRHDVGLLGSPSFEIPRSVERDGSVTGPKTDAELREGLRVKNRYNRATMRWFLFVRWLRFFGVTILALGAADLYSEFGALAIAGGLVAAVLFNVAYAILVERVHTGFRPLTPRTGSIYDPYYAWHERLWKLGAQPLFNGTPFKNVIWRLLGVRLGRRLFDDGCAIPEKTLATIGDDCTLNAGSVIQCHSLEDGVFKSDHATIGDRCTVGVEAFIHYGVAMADGSVLEADSFLMKGEEVSRHTRWLGNPAREMRHGPSVVPPVAPAPSSGFSSPAATRLLGDLRATPAPELPQSSGIELSLFSLEACKRREGELAGFLGGDEAHEAAAFDSTERRSVFVTSRALVRLILSTEWRPDVAPQAWQFGRTRLGKLTVAGPADTGIEVSISHAERVLAVAVSRGHEVGVDIEPSLRRTDPIVWSVLSPAERARLQETPVADRPSEFLRMWTLKEAFAKCTGEGASIGFEGLETSLDPPGVAAGDVADPETLFWFHQEQWALEDEPHWVAVAGRTAPPPSQAD